MPPTYWRLASLHLTSYILHLKSYIYLTPYTNLTPYNLHLPYTLYKPYTLQFTPYTLLLTPYILQLTPYIRRTFEHFINILREMCSVLIHVKPIIDRPNSTEKY